MSEIVNDFEQAFKFQSIFNSFPHINALTFVESTSLTQHCKLKIINHVESYITDLLEQQETSDVNRLAEEMEKHALSLKQDHTTSSKFQTDKVLLKQLFPNSDHICFFYKLSLENVATLIRDNIENNNAHALKRIHAASGPILHTYYNFEQDNENEDDEEEEMQKETQKEQLIKQDDNHLNNILQEAIQTATVLCQQMSTDTCVRKVCSLFFYPRITCFDAIKIIERFH